MPFVYWPMLASAPAEPPQAEPDTPFSAEARTARLQLQTNENRPA